MTKDVFLVSKFLLSRAVCVCVCVSDFVCVTVIRFLWPAFGNRLVCLLCNLFHKALLLVACITEFLSYNLNFSL